MASPKDKHLDNAQKLIAKGHYDKAANEYRALLKLDPDLRHRQRLAELLVKAGDRDGAVEEYKGIARYYADNHFLLKAIAVLKQVQKLAPDDVSVTLSLGDLNRQQGLTGNSITEYQAAFAYYEKRHNLIDAVAVLQKMLDVDPENLKTRITLAERRFSIGEHDKAFEDFLLVAEKVRQQGDAALLRQITGRISTLFPGRSQMDPVADLAERLKGGDVAGVIPQLLAMAESAPSREVAELLLDASRRAGDARAFQTACELAIRFSPSDPGPRRGLLGLALQHQGPETAMALLESWSENLREIGHLSLLHALCREAAPTFKGNDVLMQRLAVLDPSLAPQLPPSPPLQQPPSSPPDLSPEATPLQEPPAAAPVATFEQWEDDLELTMSGEEEPTFEQEEFLDLEIIEEEQEEVALQEEEPLQPDTDEGLVPVTLTAADLSRQKWSLVGDVSVSFEELSLDDEVAEPAAPTFPAGLEAGADDLFSEEDLGDFGDEFLPAPSDEAGTPPSGKYGLEGLFSEFKRGIDSNVEAGDTETHFNLGIAYKEMGLLDDAIASFAAASSDPARRIDCIVLQGLCYREQGNLDAAEETLRRGNGECAPGSEASCVLLYELAQLQESRGETAESLRLFEQVRQADPLFRDVAERIVRLGGTVNDLELMDLELVEE